MNSGWAFPSCKLPPVLVIVDLNFKNCMVGTCLNVLQAACYVLLTACYALLTACEMSPAFLDAALGPAYSLSNP